MPRRALVDFTNFCGALLARRRWSAAPTGLLRKSEIPESADELGSDSLLDPISGSPVSRHLPGFDAQGAEVACHVVEFLDHAADSPLTLLLPFTAAHSRQMRPLAEALSRHGVNSVIVDLPGHGRSGGARGTFQVEQLMRTIGSLTESYHHRYPNAPLSLVGSSWGGDLALLYALWEQHQHRQSGRPRRVGAVLAQAVITPWLRETVLSFRRSLSLLFDPRGIGLEVARAAIGPRMPVAQMFRISQVYHSVRRRRQFVADPLTLKSYDTASYLEYLTWRPPIDPGALEIPIGLLIGQHDRLVPLRYEAAVFEALKASHSRTTLTVLPGGSHALFEEKTQSAALFVARWLQKAALVGNSAPVPLAPTL